MKKSLLKIQLSSKKVSLKAGAEHSGINVISLIPFFPEQHLNFQKVFYFSVLKKKFVITRNSRFIVIHALRNTLWIIFANERGRMKDDIAFLNPILIIPMWFQICCFVWGNHLCGGMWHIYISLRLIYETQQPLC